MKYQGKSQKRKARQEGQRRRSRRAVLIIPSRKANVVIYTNYIINYPGLKLVSTSLCSNQLDFYSCQQLDSQNCGNTPVTKLKKSLLLVQTHIVHVLNSFNFRQVYNACTRDKRSNKVFVMYSPCDVCEHVTKKNVQFTNHRTFDHDHLCWEKMTDEMLFEACSSTILQRNI